MPACLMFCLYSISFRRPSVEESESFSRLAELLPQYGYRASILDVRNTS